MDVPPITKMFGLFHVKYASFLISLSALVVGGFGLAGIILHGLVENSTMFKGDQLMKSDISLKKAVLVLVGLSSLLMFAAGALLMLGVTLKLRAVVTVAVWTLFGMCVTVITLSISAPLTCFFMQNTCIVKQISTVSMVMGYLLIMSFLLLWLYFVVIVYNYLMEM